MTKRLTGYQLRDGTYIEDGVEFISSKMTGKWVRGSDYLNLSWGNLPYQYKTCLMDEMRENKSSMFYIVFSYFTPIAWRTAREPWRIPPETYSHATTMHQNIVRLAARASGEEEPWIKSTA